MARSRKRKQLADVLREAAVTAIFAVGGLALLGVVLQADFTEAWLQSFMQTMKPTGPTNAGVVYEQEMAKRAAK
jgi:hypothetical protein